MDPLPLASSAGPGARKGVRSVRPGPARLQGEAVDPHGHRVRLPRLQGARSVWELKASGGHVVGRVLRSLKILGNGTKVLLIREHFGAHTRTADSLHTGVRDTQECETPHLSRDVRGRRSCGGSGLR